MNWHSAVQGAQVGAAIGAVTGLVPLILGFLCRENRKAIVGFLVCTLVGAVGGTYAAIAAMATATVQIAQPRGQTGERTTQWSGLATGGDKIWYLLAMCWLFFCAIGGMLVSAALVIPLVLGAPDGSPKDSVEKAEDLLLLLGGLSVGAALGFVGVSFVCRRFLTSTTHRNWARDMEVGTFNRSKLLKRLAGYYYGLLLPRNFQASKLR